jgi:hypothetical protein
VDNPRTKQSLFILGALALGFLAYKTVFSGFHLSIRLILLVVAIGALGWMAYEHFYGDDYRPKTLAVATVIIALVGFLEYRAQAAEQTFGRAATEVAKRPVGVRCQGVLGHLVDIGQELGSVMFNAEGDPADVTHIKREACDWAKDYARGNRRVTRNHAVAVEVLAHESIHLRGWTDEAITECYGMQNMVEIAVALGASPTQGQRLAEFYYANLYPLMPDEYRNETDCQNEGRWDIHKGDPVWP